MDIDFASEQLALVETEAAAETLLPVVVIERVRDRLAVLRAAPCLNTLKSWQSFGLLPAEDGGTHNVHVHENWSMTISVQATDGGVSTTILSVGLKIKKQGEDNDKH